MLVALCFVSLLLVCPNASLDFSTKYKDYRRVMTRPMYHMPWVKDTDGFHYPGLYLLSAFLDTRPFLLQPPAHAQLQVILVAALEVGMVFHATPSAFDGLHCLYRQADGSFHHQPLRTAPIRLDQQLKEYMGTCDSHVTEADIRARSMKVPEFLTVARFDASGSFTFYSCWMMTICSWKNGTKGYEDINELSWVHIGLIPLVTQDTKEVSQYYDEKHKVTLDSWLSKEMYESGNGDFATLPPTPLMRGRYQSTLVSWLSFQELLGVKKVLIYLLDPSVVEQKIIEHYESKGLVEVFHFRLSKYMTKRNRWGGGGEGENKCTRGGLYHRETTREDLDRGDEVGMQKWSNCTDLFGFTMYWWGQSSITQHSLLMATSRFRWIASLDFDEFLLPLVPIGPTFVNVSTTYYDLVLAIRNNQQEMIDCKSCFYPLRYPDQDQSCNETTKLPIDSGSFPISFRFSLASFCYHCDRNLVPRVSVPPSPMIPSSSLLIEPHPTLTTIIWASVRQPPKPKKDRSKNILDPIAVFIHNCHEVGHAWLSSNQTSWMNVPSYSKKDPTSCLWANVSPDAALIVHARVYMRKFHHLYEEISFKVVEVWKEAVKQSSNLSKSVWELANETKFVNPLESCRLCDHNPSIPEVKDLVVVDFSLANRYGYELMNRVDSFLKTFEFPTHHHAFRTDEEELDDKDAWNILD